MKKINLYTAISLAFLMHCNSVLAEPIEINFAYIGDKADSAYSGIQQGLIESNLQGQFLDQKYSVDSFESNQWQKQDLSKFIGILTVVNKDELLAIGNAYPDTPIFNLAVPDNSLRSACIKNLLHIIPSQKMLSDAMAQWNKKKPGSSATARAWHADFKKFAARDLNKRFLKNQKTRMDDHAWAGWAAVRMTSDSVARETISKPDDLLTHLKTKLSFDGQKGSNMNFRETGQLRQLILLVENNEIVAEAPVRGIAKPPTLDSLGLLNCEK